MRHPQDAATIPRISYPQDAPPILGCIFPRMVAAILRIRPSQDASDHPRMGRPICRWAVRAEKPKAADDVNNLVLASAVRVQTLGEAL